MSSTTLLTIGTRAMFANAAALQVTGHNIANANTAGFSRQQVELATATGQFTGDGYFGRGVDVQTVTRTHDAFLTREAQLSTSLAEKDKARLEQLDRLELVFDLGEDGVGHAAGQVFNAMVDVANNPQDLSARQVALSAAEVFASRLRGAAGEVEALQAGTVSEVKVSVDTVNRLAKQVADLNNQIAAARGSNHPPNDLLDQRDRVIGEISEQIQVTTLAADDGSIGLFIAGGQRLVLGGSAQALTALPDAFDPSRVTIGIVEAGVTRTLDAAMLAGGRIAGLLEFQNRDLVDARNLLGQIAAAVSGAVNEQQALGLDARQPPGVGAPIFDAGDPRALPAAGNARAADGSFIASVSLAIADPALLQASDYELAADPSGAPGLYQLTRRSDGLVRSVADGDTVDGFTLTIGPPAPAATDRFLLQPVARAGVDLRRTLDDPRGIAAASPVAATAAATNTGTASVASLLAVSTTIDPSLSATIAFTSAAGAYDWELRDSANTLVANGSGTWTPGSPIALNGFELSLNGVPDSGDSFSVAATAFPATNNGNALGLVALRDARLVGGQTVTDAYASVLADIGVRISAASAASDMSASVASDAKNAVASKAGVNLDEEAARLLQFQQSYQAAARVLQVAQSVFDTLLSVTGG